MFVLSDISRARKQRCTTSSTKECNELSFCSCNDNSDLIEYVGEIEGKVNQKIRRHCLHKLFTYPTCVFCISCKCSVLRMDNTLNNNYYCLCIITYIIHGLIQFHACSNQTIQQCGEAANSMHVKKCSSDSTQYHFICSWPTSSQYDLWFQTFSMKGARQLTVL